MPCLQSLILLYFQGFLHDLLDGIQLPSITKVASAFLMPFQSVNGG